MGGRWTEDNGVWRERANGKGNGALMVGLGGWEDGVAVLAAIS